jgi:hypothetical protein
VTQLYLPNVKIEIADRDSWCTPSWLWSIPLKVHDRDAYCVDPCSNRWSTVPAVRKVMPPEDGITARYQRPTIAWLNCPYSDVLPWFRLAVNLVNRFNTSVYGVVPHAPSIRAWQQFGPIRAWSLGRVDFDPPPGVARGNGGNQEHDLVLWQPFGRYPPSDARIVGLLKAARRPATYIMERTEKWPSASTS